MRWKNSDDPIIFHLRLHLGASLFLLLDFHWLHLAMLLLLHDVEHLGNVVVEAESDSVIPVGASRRLLEGILGPTTSSLDQVGMLLLPQSRGDTQINAAFLARSLAPLSLLLSL